MQTRQTSCRCKSSTQTTASMGKGKGTGFCTLFDVQWHSLIVMLKQWYCISMGVPAKQLSSYNNGYHSLTWVSTGSKACTQHREARCIVSIWQETVVWSILASSMTLQTGTHFPHGKAAKCQQPVLLDPGQPNWGCRSTHQHKDPENVHLTCTQHLVCELH